MNNVRGTRVEVILKDGQKMEETVLVPKGDPEKPLTRADIVNKLRTCAQGQADEETLGRLVRSIEAIDGSERFEDPFSIK